MYRAIILIVGLTITLSVGADDDEYQELLQEIAEINARLSGNPTQLGVSEGYGGRPLGRTWEEEQRLKREDDNRAWHDDRRQRTLQSQLARQQQEFQIQMEAERQAARQRSAARSAAAYEQVIQSMQSQQRPLPESPWEPPPSRIQVPTADEYFQQKRTQPAPAWGSTPQPVVFPDSPVDFSGPQVPYTPSPRPVQRTPAEAFNEGAAVGRTIGKMLRGIMDGPKRKRKEAILKRYANGTITDDDYRQLVADGHVDLAVDLLTAEEAIERSGR